MLIICKFVVLIQCFSKLSLCLTSKLSFPANRILAGSCLLPTRRWRRPSCASCSHRASSGKTWRIVSAAPWVFAESPGCSERFKGFPLFLFLQCFAPWCKSRHGTVGSGVVRNGEGYTQNFTPPPQLKLQTFIPPVPSCKWEWPTGNLCPSEVSAQHFCLYFFWLFFLGKPL